jgi:hypothetical protein
LTNEEAKTRAEALFIRKEKQAREGANAMAEYQAARAAEAEKTARLRAARLAREAELKARGTKEECGSRRTKRG